jgi:hypothetical protein
VIWGLAVAACFGAVAATALAAQRTSTSPNPAPLWNAYPLDDGASNAGQSGSSGATGTAGGSGGGAAASAAHAPKHATTAHLTDDAGDGPPWLLMAAAAAGGALFVVLLLVIQGHRARKRERYLVATGAADEWPWLGPSNGRREGGAAKGALPPEPAFEIVEALAVPRHRFERAATRSGEAEGAAASGVAEGAEPREAAQRAERDGVAEGAAAANGVAKGAERNGVAEGAAASGVDGAAAANGVADGAERNGVAEGAERNSVAEGAERHGVAEAAGRNGVAEAGAQGGSLDGALPNGKPADSRRGPICQVRWSRAGACFYAVVTDDAGLDEQVARSPSFEWHGHQPPDEESREARAALRVLAKELRDMGWRPMRVKGSDFDEQRWYARRFRGPVAGGAELSAPRSGSAGG